MSTFAAVVLFIGVLAYAVLGGADYGAGFWDLTAGGAERGREPRHLVDQSLAPVWEANHVWLIFCLVMLWTGFPAAFAAIMTTLYVPLGLAALGIVVRGARLRVPQGHRARPSSSGSPAPPSPLSSVLTPFFLGAVGRRDRLRPGADGGPRRPAHAAGSTRRRCSAACSPCSPAPSSRPCSSPPRPGAATSRPGAAGSGAGRRSPRS